MSENIFSLEDYNQASWRQKRNPMTPAEIKSARLALGLTAKQMAAIMETTENNIYRIESGSRPPPARFVKVLEMLAASEGTKVPLS